MVILLLAIAFTFSGCAYHGEIARLPDTALYNQAVRFGNVRYLPLLRYCNYYNLEWDWDLVSQKIEIKKGRNTVVLRPDSNLALFNDKAMMLEHPIEYRNGAAYIPVEAATFISEKVFRLGKALAPVMARHKIETIVIDPGHGGKDPGAISRRGTREKDIVFDVAKRLKRDLQKEGLNVILTREKDVFIPLYKRAQFANEKGADLFISIHANASRSSRMKGVEVFYLSEATDDKARALAAVENASFKFEEGEIAKNRNKSTMTTVWDMKLKENRRESKELAYYICNIASDDMRMKKRGVKSANFAVLRRTVMPAVLVEVGFITNRRDELKLKKRSFREEIADSISRSIMVYKREYERTNGFSR